MSSASPLPKRPLTFSSSRDIRNLVWSTLALRFLIILIAFLSSYLPLFDASPSLVSHDPDSFLSRFASVAVRWDAFHFLTIAQHGYRYEYQYAFMPGLPIILRILSRFGALFSSSGLISSIIPYFICATLFSLDTTRLLYLLTLHHTKSRHSALLSAYLSLLPSSPSTLHLAPYTEPWFTWASYRGMLYSAQNQWLKAACAFLFAGCFRSNAFMLGGFIFWGVIIEHWLDRKKIRPLKFILASVLSVFPLAPFLLHQHIGYQAFCVNTSHPRPWCAHRLPFIYAHAQSSYWNNGFLRYWTPQQIPNFVISAPVVLLLFWGSLRTISNVVTSVRAKKGVSDVSHWERASFQSRSILPHAIYALLYTLLLLFFGHTQIVLRQAAAIPFLYWGVARLFLEKSVWSYRWIIWVISWNLTSIILWTTFLPPA